MGPRLAEHFGKRGILVLIWDSNFGIYGAVLQEKMVDRSLLPKPERAGFQFRSDTSKKFDKAKKIGSFGQRCLQLLHGTWTLFP
jgi:hypothetical protein